MEISSVSSNFTILVHVCCMVCMVFVKAIIMENEAEHCAYMNIDVVEQCDISMQCKITD